MGSRVVTQLVDDAVGEVAADALAVGVRVGDDGVSRCRGVLAGSPVDGDTVFYAASVTKQVVGLLLADAVESGRATPDDRLVDWLSELPPWMREVRLHHLLHHTSGLPDLTRPAPRRPDSNAEVVGRYRAMRPLADLGTGTRRVYNNGGYVLLAEVVVRICGVSLPELAAGRLFRPTGMTRTRLGGAPVRLGGVLDPPQTIGDGGLWTSAADLVRWSTACNEARFGPAVQARVEATGIADSVTGAADGWGLRVRSTLVGRVITHGGSWHTWLAKTVRIPERGVAVAVLSTGGQELEISGLGVRLAEQLAGARPCR